ncbi:hypothetical protein FHR20_001104 [Sphingomonas leidyi]|uniref:Uncharacterized protein n=1 Tax=Sphingomonas leidyi TaxID=68569 RepID=A0A7X5UXU1_9SPHN|nr:hypothetical protein [Sphingomonas leidyi]NIJ64173.1 hypothetical protein [Sphingomonas leidyi]
MGLFDWLKRRARAQAPMPAPIALPAPAAAPEMEPEGLWQTGVEADRLWVRAPEGDRQAVTLEALAAVAIETSDTGPDGRGAWWLFYGPDEDVAFTLPLGARGEGAMVERIAALPGFRHDAYATAIRSAGIDTFVIWQRPFD